MSLEKVLELKPDLIITWNVEDVAKYEKLPQQLSLLKMPINQRLRRLRQWGIT